MTVLGYHASHEQLSPAVLLDAVRRAELAGFEAAMCSDHLSPWGLRQGHSGFAWSWLGAALATTSIPFGVVTAPGQRYHPVVLAQAVATLTEIFPGRFWAAYGSGEAINEHITGQHWPDKASRQRRLAESVEVIRRLHLGAQVELDSEVRVHEARVWSLPAEPPPVIAAAVSEETARWAAGWAEGLITVGSDPDSTASLIAAYREEGGQGEVMLQMHISLADSHEAALALAREQWRQATAPAELMWDLEQPEDFDARSRPTQAALEAAVAIAASPRELAERIAAEAGGVDAVFLHHVGQDQGAFLDRAPELLGLLREML